MSQPVAGPRCEVELGCQSYPELLSQISDPPNRLYVIGDLRALADPFLAIIGARKATPYGLDCAALFARVAADQQIPVVSGAAIGCDQSAQRSALSAGGRVVAVLGCGADICYPASAADLLAGIVSQGGAVVSEYPWGAHPCRGAFVRRNRIIAGLALAILIVEAGLHSGTYSTADAAANAGRDVLVVPGSIFSAESRGSNHLLVEHATPVVDETSFIDALSTSFGLPFRTEVSLVGEPPGGGAPVDAEAGWVLRALAANPMRPDVLAQSMGRDVAYVVQLLSRLEAARAVERFRDGRYGATTSARVHGGNRWCAP